MISALERIGGVTEPADLPRNTAALGIHGRGFMRLLSSHPPIVDRIAALSAMPVRPAGE